MTRTKKPHMGRGHWGRSKDLPNHKKLRITDPGWRAKGFKIFKLLCGILVQLQVLFGWIWELHGLRRSWLLHFKERPKLPRWWPQVFDFGYGNIAGLCRTVMANYQGRCWPTDGVKLFWLFIPSFWFILLGQRPSPAQTPPCPALLSPCPHQLRREVSSAKESTTRPSFYQVVRPQLHCEVRVWPMAPRWPAAHLPAQWVAWRPLWPQWLGPPPAVPQLWRRRAWRLSMARSGRQSQFEHLWIEKSDDSCGTWHLKKRSHEPEHRLTINLLHVGLDYYSCLKCRACPAMLDPSFASKNPGIICTIRIHCRRFHGTCSPQRHPTRARSWPTTSTPRLWLNPLVMPTGRPPMWPSTTEARCHTLRDSPLACSAIWSVRFHSSSWLPLFSSQVFHSFISIWGGGMPDFDRFCISNLCIITASEAELLLTVSELIPDAIWGDRPWPWQEGWAASQDPFVFHRLLSSWWWPKFKDCVFVFLGWSWPPNF